MSLFVENMFNIDDTENKLIPLVLEHTKTLGQVVKNLLIYIFSNYFNIKLMMMDIFLHFSQDPGKNFRPENPTVI